MTPLVEGLAFSTEGVIQSLYSSYLLLYTKYKCEEGSWDPQNPATRPARLVSDG